MRSPEHEGEATRVDDLVLRALTLKPAPTPLHHIQLLLNSRNRLARYDRLSDTATAAEWLTAIADDGSPIGPEGIDEADLARLRAFREAVRDVLTAHSTGQAPQTDSLQRLSAAGVAPRLSVHFGDSGDPVLRPSADSHGVQRITDTVLAAWTTARPEHLQRLKACVNPDCGWVFYDTSRSRSGTWCVMNICGARHKMAKYRSRQR